MVRKNRQARIVSDPLTIDEFEEMQEAGDSGHVHSRLGSQDYQLDPWGEVVCQTCFLSECLLHIHSDYCPIVIGERKGITLEQAAKAAGEVLAMDPELGEADEGKVEQFKELISGLTKGKL